MLQPSNSALWGNLQAIQDEYQNGPPVRTVMKDM